MDPPALCLLVWTDGWGEHTCGLPEGHAGRHSCHCDATAGAWAETEWAQREVER